MSLRLSPSEAVARKLISEKEAKQIRSQGRRHLSAPESSRPTQTKKKKAKVLRLEPDPQQRLWDLLNDAYPGWADKQWMCWEMGKVIPGRRFRVDIAFTQHRCAIELDGWEFHGKYKEDFKRDREKDRLMTLQGWRTVRVFASEVKSRPDMLIEEIGQILQLIEAERGLQLPKAGDNEC